MQAKEKLLNPYMHIELSTDTESEGEREIHFRKDTKTKKLKKHVKSAKSKRYEQLNQFEKKIKDGFEVLNLSKVEDLFNDFANEIKKSSNFINKYGTPLSFLRTVRLVNRALVTSERDIEDEINLNFKDNKLVVKSNLKATKILRMKIKKFYQTYKLKIEEAERNKIIDDNEVSEPEQIYASDQESEDEKKEINFSKRLTLSREERRKFWLVKAKKVKQTKKKYQNRDIQEIDFEDKKEFKKEFLEEIEKFDNFDIRELRSKLFKLYQENDSQKFENLDSNLRFISFIIRKLEKDEKKSVERYLECLILHNDFNFLQIKRRGILNTSILKEISSILKKLILTHEAYPEVLPLNFVKGEKEQYTKKELIRKIHNIATLINLEIGYALKLKEPFSQAFVNLLNESFKFTLYTLDDLSEFFQNNADEEMKIFYKTDIVFKQLEHIYYIPNDFVIQSEFLSNYFEEELDEKVMKLVRFIKANTKEANKLLCTELYQIFNYALNDDRLDQVA